MMPQNLQTLLHTLILLSKYTHEGKLLSVMLNAPLIKGYQESCYDATTRTRSPRGKLTNQNVNLEQCIGSFLVSASNKGLFDMNTEILSTPM